MKREYYDDLPKECLRDKRGKMEGRINVIDGAIEEWRQETIETRFKGTKEQEQQKLQLLL